MNAGDKILQIGRHGRPDEQLRFDKDLMIDVTLNGAKHPLDLLVRRLDQKNPEWLSLTPTDRLADSDRPATLGVRNAGITTVAAVRLETLAPGQDAGYRELLPGDEIVAVDGVPLSRDPQEGSILEHELERQLARRMTQPVTLTIRRPAKTPVAAGAMTTAAPPQTLQITVPPTRLRTTGLVMEIGPVLGVRQGSPAEKAGFRTGDVLVSMAGQDIGDPVTLGQRILPSIGKEIEFGVRRDGAGNPVLMRATPVAPDAFRDGFSYCAPVGVESLGLAFQLTNVVKEVLPDSPAGKAGFRAGDRISSVSFLKDGKELPDPVELIKTESWSSRLWRRLRGPASDQAVGEKVVPNWYVVHTTLNLEPSLDLKLTYRRGQEERAVALHPVESDRFFYPARRFVTQPLSLVRTAASWSEAWSLGYAETEVSVKKVLAVLQRLCTGKISYRSLGGPIMIVRAAGSEASEGLARLLVFLTFLSANLAVLNFLPIPALDGGHMLFLAAEWARGKPLNERLQVTLTLIGVGCLLSLMVLVFTLDIQRFF
jgi:regulator of sigma E protease